MLSILSVNKTHFYQPHISHFYLILYNFVFLSLLTYTIQVKNGILPALHEITIFFFYLQPLYFRTKNILYWFAIQKDQLLTVNPMNTDTPFQNSLRLYHFRSLKATLSLLSDLSYQIRYLPQMIILVMSKHFFFIQRRYLL